MSARVTPRRVRARRRRIAQAAVLALVAGVLAALAYRYDGAPIQDVELNSGGVWVTNGDLQMMARLNSQVRELEMGLLTSATSDVVFQQGASVQVLDDGGGSIDRALRMVDPVTGTVAPVVLPESFVARAGGGTVAMTDRGDGRTWVMRVDRVAGFTESTPADFDVDPRSTVAVTRSGTALVADRSGGTVTAYRVDETGVPVAGEVFDFETEFTDGAELGAVGEVPVVLQEGNLLRPGVAAVEVPGENPVLQAVGPESEFVRVASEEGLWEAELDGGGLDEVTEVEAKGFAAPPVVVEGCVYAAWAAPGVDNFQRNCGDDVFAAQVEELTTASELVFRTNRDVVVLNDVVTGNAWLVEEEGLTLVDNWEAVNPNAQDPQVAEASDKKVTNSRNKPPEAVDDEFGARPGSTVVLPVTLNDVDPDGDILTLTKPPASTAEVTYSVTGGGTQVQARVAATASGTIGFDYEISDGRGHANSEASVELEIFDSEVDKAPALIDLGRGVTMPNELTVAAGHAASVNVLPSWIDPEGDALVLTAASSDGGEVGFRPDGTIDFLDDNESPRKKVIDFTIQGGTATVDGTVEVTVADPDKARPKVVADRFAGPVGSTILLEPLVNDTDPLGGQMTLPRLAVVDGGPATIAKDSGRGTATFRSDRSGTFYLEYEAAASNGQVSKTSVIRVDVTERGGNNQPPVATRDVAAVRADGSVLVDVLANDIDPDGDVMVVQGVRIPPKWQEQVTASLINKRFVRVEVAGQLTGERPEFEYLLSDGESDQVAGAVAVVRADNVRNRRPVATEDLVTVRAGTIVTIPVLDNDEDPDGDALTVRQPDLFDVDTNTDWVADGKVPIVATGSGIRVMVPDDGTTQMQIGYGVRDTDQARADTRLVLNIKPDDPENNRPPEPSPIEDRTVSGQRIRVPVDIFGADPDGDPVVYTGLVEPPSFGRIVRSGAAWFEYEPYESVDNTGTDEFKIVVTDPYGASATADVRIGVAARSPINQPPAALDDTLRVKPGLTIQYPVMQNDSDPDGDPLLLEADKFSAPEGVTAKVTDDFVEMKVGELGKRSEVTTSAIYSVTDGLGTSSSALLTVTARKDAPDHAPLAGDDVVTTDQMAGKSAGDTVDVDVLANDGDLDGSRAALEIESLTDGSEVADRELRVTLTAESRVVPYKITDATGQFSFGFVYVSGTNQMPPRLNVAAVPVEVIAGEAETIALEDVVVVRDGRSPKVARVDQISSSNGDTKAEGLKDLEFRAPPTYHGPASITLDVIDGENLNDPEGLRSQITIPISVLPAGNVPPEVRSTSVLVYAGGEGRTIDLARLSTDVNEDELSFEVSGAKDGVETEIDDEVLTVSARGGAPSGEMTLDVTASDGEAEPVSGQVQVTVIGVTQGEGEDEEEQVEEKPEPPMQLVELNIADGEAGQTETIDVTDAVAFDPYPDEAKSVTFVSVTGPAPQPSFDGSTISVTPSESGEVVVTYRLDDGSGDRKREISGRVVIVVADVPEAPGAPSAVEGGPDSVQLTWRAPADNGSPIEGYLVYEKGSSDPVQECVATQCVIEGLAPGEEYQYSVSAENGIGEGEKSALSVPVTPDTVPDTMVAPVIANNDYTDRNGQLHLSWAPGATQGSSITHYEIESSPGTGTKQPAWGETSMVWGGLSNGTSYRFRIRAVNERGPGVWSPWSAADTPFTKPSKMSPPALVAAGNNNAANEGYLQVSWAQTVSPNDGYDTVTSYTVQLYKDGAPSTTKSVQTTSTDFSVQNGHQYTATVAATNRAGTSDPSGQSAPVHTWDRAGSPSGISKVSDCVGCTSSTSAYQGRVSFRSPSDNGGYAVTAFRYQTEDGSSGTWSASGAERNPGATITRDLPFRSANQGQHLTITPITNPPGQPATAGAPATGGNFNPYAKPFKPTISNLSGYREVKARFSCNGNGRPVKSLTIHRYGAADETLPRRSCSPTWTESWSPIEGGDARCLQSSIETVAGESSTLARNSHGCLTADAPTITVGFDAGANVSDAKCDRPCYNVTVKVRGLLGGDWKMTATANGGRCDGVYQNPYYVSVNSSTGEGFKKAGWYISNNCGGTVTVTVHGQHDTFSDTGTVP